ncbi:MAG: DUF2087 domain-containing protein [Clostridium sp.]|nr:DUF2087 domain-containing protein [Clostridium sp.]
MMDPADQVNQINQIDTMGIKQFLNHENQLIGFPKKRKLQLTALFYLASKFEPGKVYSEKEINGILNDWHTFLDCAMLRRYLIDMNLLCRNDGGREYWVPANSPTPEDFQMWLIGKHGM